VARLIAKPIRNKLSGAIKLTECIWPAETILGEAPFWCSETKRLYWLDIVGKNIYRFDPETGGCETFPQPYEFGCIVKRAKGGFIGATNKGLVLVEDDLKTLEIFSDPEANLDNNRFNDGKCDRYGRFWAGSTDIDEADPTGALYSVDTSLVLDKQFSNVIVANGLVLYVKSSAS
jgi:sugar lactone lactonase YvrE